MRVCILSRSDGKAGGFAAAYRLQQGLQQSNVDSFLVVGEKTHDDERVLPPSSRIGKVWNSITNTVDSLPIRFYKEREKTTYSLQWLPSRLTQRIAKINPDIINIHWINAGYFSVEGIAKLNRPIVLTLHDMWGFTGGCHYSSDCDRYTKACGACPQLNSNSENDLSRWVWERKWKKWHNLNLTIVTPSNWLAKCARESSLFSRFKIEVIPNGIDSNLYRSIPKKLAREILRLPQEKKLILFGATSLSPGRKGFQFLEPTLKILNQSRLKDQIELVTFGTLKSNFICSIKVNHLGKLHDQISLVLAYSAADVFILPSVEDNLPNTVMEALSCSTPCVSFNVGGLADMIVHQQNGYLAIPFNLEDFARGIRWILEDSERYKYLSKFSRQKVEQEFTLDLQAARYLRIFSETYGNCE
ncbi:glycosyltransferase family 4 protein [Nostoc sp. CCCryo 231-06]|nr:glycosyltransferase family 4 protein [Nostoc sp. CCCryo 231-06]